MKTAPLLCLLLLLAGALHAQNNPALRISADYCKSDGDGTPLTLLKGITGVNSACDTLFILNKDTWQHYKLSLQLLDKYEDLSESNNAVIALQEKHIKDVSAAFKDFKDISFKTINESQTALTQANQSLESARQVEKNAIETLNEIKKDVKAQKRNNFLAKIGYALGGLGVGILIGILAN
jgi:hypothetical protein